MTKRETLEHFAILDDVNEVHASLEEVEGVMQLYSNHEKLTLQAKYDKLKAAFEALLEKSCKDRELKFESREQVINVWMEEAGLK